MVHQKLRMPEQKVGGVRASNVAKWNGTNWACLGEGILGGGPLGGYVFSLVASSRFVYVGGVITNAGGVAVRGVARWDGTNWHSFSRWGGWLCSCSRSVGRQGVRRRLVSFSRGDHRKQYCQVGRDQLACAGWRSKRVGLRNCGLLRRRHSEDLGDWAR